MVTLFDHYSNQTHESVTKFLSNWGTDPWNDMNVPIFLALREDDGKHIADVIVYHPRKEHIKHVEIEITDDEEMEALRKTFLGIGEKLYEAAAYNLEAFAKGGMPECEDDEWGGLVLYYWERDTFIKE